MRKRTYILLLLLIGFLIYVPALFNGFVGDDDLQIVRNLEVHSISNFFHFFQRSTYETAGSQLGAGLFYRPMMATAFAMVYTLFGPDPLPFHLLQLLLHIANAILVFYFFKKFFTEGIAFVGALFFLVHPINVEAVAYSANLQETLFFFFGMIALVWRSPLVLLAALLSKESGILFFPVIALYERWFVKKKPQIKKLAVHLIVVLGVYLVLRFGVAHLYGGGGSIAPIAHASLGDRLITMPAILWYYIRMTLFPFPMGTAQYWVVSTISWKSFFLPLIGVVASIFLFVRAYHVVRMRKVDLAKSYLFFTIWFVIGLVLHLQLIPLDVTVADRWMYFPFIGLIGMICCLAVAYITTQARRRVISGITFITLALLSVGTVVRVTVWRSELVLYGHDIKVTPRNFVLDDAYASALINDGQFVVAKPYLASSVRQYPYASNLNNMAIVLTAEKDIDGAEEYFRKAIEQSDNFSVYENYAAFLLYYRSAKTAADFAQQALSKFPSSPKLQSILNTARSVPPAQQDKPLPIEPF